MKHAVGTEQREAAGAAVLGYVSGVWDMFHIGHLNIIMRARARCDRLVVGVVTDEVVWQAKGRRPVIPLAERLDIVRGLRDVDDVVADPYEDKFDSWRLLLRYDVLFKGDDWEGTPKAERLIAELTAVGARMEFFPYTAHTSSTLLRDVLSRLAHTPVEPDPDADRHLGPHAGHALSLDAGHRADVADAVRRADRASAEAVGWCPTCGQRLDHAGAGPDAPTPTRGFRPRVHEAADAVRVPQRTD